VLPAEAEQLPLQHSPLAPHVTPLILHGGTNGTQTFPVHVALQHSVPFWQE
jgi:hypothetical protein